MDGAAKKLKRLIKRMVSEIWNRVWEFWAITREGEKLKKVRQQEIVRVAFVIIHHATWKTDDLFKLLSMDPQFKPTIIIAPDTTRSKDLTEEYMRMCEKYFEYRGFSYIRASCNDSENSAIINKVNPDVIIFNNPHGLTVRSLNRKLVLNKLACYIPYHMEVGCYNGDQDQYNRPFHNGMWKIFAPHSSSFETFRRIARRKGKNVVVSGYPGVEALVSSQDNDLMDPWKPLGLKRIIWAPHHTIDMPNLPYANFLRYAEFFRELVERYSDRAQWCFKPHPLLKPKLINHPDWGAERTDEYFRFWESHSVTQLELGEYVGLFRHSDAMLHDSGSFLAEYLYVNKPVMYLWSSPDVVQYFNSFGLDALGACQRGDNEPDITRFIEAVLRGEDSGSEQRRGFLSKHPISIDGELPSHRILKKLKSEIWPS